MDRRHSSGDDDGGLLGILQVNEAWRVTRPSTTQSSCCCCCYSGGDGAADDDNDKYADYQCFCFSIILPDTY